MNKLYIRVDGNATIGTGHLVRCLSLYENLQQPFECTLIFRKSSLEAVKEYFRVSDVNYKVLTDGISLSEEVTELSAFVSKDCSLVLDGYDFDFNYQKNARSLCRKLIYIDDQVTKPISADVVINYTAGLDQKLFHVEQGTQLCLGLQYLLLRKPFLELARERETFNQDHRHVFVNFGGADPGNHTIRLIEDLKNNKQMESLVLHVVTGVSYPNKHKLNECIRNAPFEVHLYSSLSTKELTGLFRMCGRAITSSSTIALEYLHSGGHLYIRQTADNQKFLFNFLISEQLALPLAAFADHAIKPNVGKIRQLFSGQTADLTRIVFE